MGKLIHYFGGGTTCIGFTNYYDNIFFDSKETYLIKGGSNSFKSEILKLLAEKYSILYNVEVIVSSVDTGDIEGIKVNELDIAIINGELIHGVNINKDKAIVIDINKAINTNIINNNKIYLDELKLSILKDINNAYKNFAMSFTMHEKIEGYYYKVMNFDKANKRTTMLLDTLVNRNLDRKGFTYHRFLGAATAEGSIDFIPNLTEGLKRYLLKGRSGTGKSTILKAIADKASKAGFDVEVYHCGFDPRSLDMVIVRGLGFAIFDSTKPHEYFPSSSSDVVIDTYLEFCDKKIDKKSYSDMDIIIAESRKYKDKGIEFLKSAKKNKIKYDEVYESATNKLYAKSIISDKLYLYDKK